MTNEEKHKPMDKKLYHRGKGEVVKQSKECPLYNESYENNCDKDDCSCLLMSKPYAYCDPSLPVGWIEGEEVYQVRRDGLSTFYKTDKHLFYKHFESDRRIWIEPKQEQPFQKEAEEFTKQKLRLVNSMLSDDYKIGYKEGVEHYLTSIAARQMSAGEVEELRRENERLKTLLYRNYKSWHIQFYHATSDLTARQIDDMLKEQYNKFR